MLEHVGERWEADPRFTFLYSLTSEPTSVADADDENENCNCLGEDDVDAFEDAIKDSTLAIDLHPQYLKAILRRAELYEKTEKLDDALKDYEAVIELDPSQHAARASCMRLQEQIKERNEKLKVEMMGKLKDLGNLVLRPFGLSTNNFKLQQDPNSGSYSVQFNQSPTGNGS